MGRLHAPSLFGTALPDGFRYLPDFVTTDEEAQLAVDIGTVQFADFEMRGVIARRRVAFFGRTYSRTEPSAAPIPAFLLPLRDRLAAWAGVEPGEFAMALINEYRAGAPIGWHRDAPQYGIVAGLSLLSSCRMRFRPYLPPREASPPADRRSRRGATHEIELEPRSAYLMTGDSRYRYEHHIPSVRALRYSVTFRSVRG